MATILALDDSASMRQMISFTLKQGGHDIIEAMMARMPWKKRRQKRLTWF